MVAKIIPYWPAAGSAVLMVAAFPDVDLGFLAWVGLVPLLAAVADRSGRQSFGIGLLFGMLFLGMLFRWVVFMPGMRPLHCLLLALVYGSGYGLFGWTCNRLSRRRGDLAAMAAAPFVWVALEYLRANCGFLALPLGLVAHSQHRYPVVIQGVSIFGTYGLGFLIVSVNAVLAGWARTVFLRTNGAPRRPKRELAAASAVCSFLVAANAIYGLTVPDRPPPEKGTTIALIQGNIPQGRKWDHRFSGEIMDTYERLTVAASQQKPALIVWPETATPGAVDEDPALGRRLNRIAAAAGTYLLTGSARYAKFDGPQEEGPALTNLAVLIGPGSSSGTRQHYAKMRLFPFTEYVPLKDLIPWQALGVPAAAPYHRGSRFTVFETDDFRFGVTICWESLFPEISRQLVRRGATMLVNITNEARFGAGPAPYQLSVPAVFRAVENRVWVARCANTGPSVIIDPNGRTAARLGDDVGGDIFTRGVVSAPVAPRFSNSLFTRWGDSAAWLALAATAGWMLSLLPQYRKNKKDKASSTARMIR